MTRHLLLDFGGVLLKTNFELNDVAERSLGLAVGALAEWRGPFDPSADPAWQRFLDGELTERGYWVVQSAKYGLDTAGLMRHFFEPSGDHLIRTEMWDLVREWKAAGRKVGILTNDMSAFHGPEWKNNITVLKEVDLIADCSFSHLKPDPRAYQHGLDEMGMTRDDVVFVDDLFVNAQGAIDAGLLTVRFDPTNVESSIAEIRSAAALGR